MEVFHVAKKRLEPLDEPYKFLNGDVYVVETDTELWIWIGSKSYADDKAVGAWGAKIAEEKNKDLTIKSVSQGDESPKFKEIIENGETVKYVHSRGGWFWKCCKSRSRKKSQ